MSAKMVYHLDDILRYLDGLQKEKKVSSDSINCLRRERDSVIKQIQQLQEKLETLDKTISKEEEICERLQQTIERANNTYDKLVESSQSLVDFVKKEYDEVKKTGSRSDH